MCSLSHGTVLGEDGPGRETGDPGATQTNRQELWDITARLLAPAPFLHLGGSHFLKRLIFLFIYVYECLPTCMSLHHMIASMYIIIT